MKYDNRIWHNQLYIYHICLFLQVGCTPVRSLVGQCSSSCWPQIKTSIKLKDTHLLFLLYLTARMGVKREFIWRMFQWLLNSPLSPQSTNSWTEGNPKASSVWSEWSVLPHLPLPGIWCSLSVDVICEPGCLWLLQVQRSAYTRCFLEQFRLQKTSKPYPAHHSHVNSNS